MSKDEVHSSYHAGDAGGSHGCAGMTHGISAQLIRRVEANANTNDVRMAVHLQKMQAKAREHREAMTSNTYKPLYERKEAQVIVRTEGGGRKLGIGSGSGGHSAEHMTDERIPKGINPVKVPQATTHMTTGVLSDARRANPMAQAHHTRMAKLYGEATRTAEARLQGKKKIHVSSYTSGSAEWGTEKKTNIVRKLKPLRKHPTLEVRRGTSGWDLWKRKHPEKAKAKRK